jgi:hypothetical protein
MTDYRTELQRLVKAYDEHGGRWPDHHEQALFQAVEAARTALAQPEPEGDGPSLAEIAELTWQHSSDLGDLRIGVAPDDVPALVAAALARWARPTIRPKGTCQPNGYAYRYPAIDGTITRFNHGQEVSGSRPLYAIPYWLGQPPTARPTIEPVPVAERPWEREKGWRDPDGECWWCPPDGPLYWQMANPAMVYGGWLLPHHAIPVPGAEEGQP